MPWKIDDPRLKSLPKAAREQWVAVANKWISENPDDDAGAARVAWGAVKRAGWEKEGHKWIKKDIGGSTMFSPFRSPFEIEKAYEKDGKWHVRGIISGPEIDRQMDRMEKSARESMVKQLKAGSVKLLDNHGATFEMGRSTDGEILPDGKVVADFETEKDHPYQPILIKEVSAGTKKQLSVGGAVTDAVKVFEKSIGGIVKSVKDVILEHVACTRESRAAYQPASLLDAMVKSVDWDGLAEPARPAEPQERGRKMEKKEALEQLTKAIADVAEVCKPAGGIDPSMLYKSEDGKGFIVKEEFAHLAKSTATDEDRKAISGLVEKLLNAAGIDTVDAVADPKPEKSASEEVDLRKELNDLKAGLTKEIAEALKKATPAVPRQGTEVSKEFDAHGNPADGAAAMFVQKAMAEKSRLEKSVAENGRLAKEGRLKGDDLYQAQKEAELLAKYQIDPLATAKENGITA